MSAAKCGTAECSALATTRVYWPNHPIDLCDACAERATFIAKAMGFSVATQTLEHDVRTDGAS